jgi:hypothetical protein
MQNTLPRLYFQNSVGRLLEHPDGYAIFQYNPGKRKLSDLQALLAHTRNLLQRNKWHRMLGDQRLMSPFTEEESTWIVNHWLDSSVERPGGLYGAIILADDVFARLSMNQVMHESKAAALTYRLFDSEEKAVAWLKQLV